MSTQHTKGARRMNTIATITGRTYRAAALIAPRKDVRPYLNSIHINTDAGEVAATDGHIMYINSMEPGADPGPAVMFEPVKIPASAETVDVCRYDDKHVMINVFGPRTGPTMHLCKLIDGRYPDYKAVVPTFDAGHARQDVAFDVKYLAILKQIFKSGARFEFNSTPGACKITGEPDEGLVVLMERRT